MKLYDRFAEAVGAAIIYPRGSAWFVDVERCLFGWYVSDNFSLSGFTWDTHHALLRMMSADPEQFFYAIKKYHITGYKVWRNSLEHAQLWGMGINEGKCPNPSPLEQAARSIDGFKFDDIAMETMRMETLSVLKNLRCHVPE